MLAGGDRQALTKGKHFAQVTRQEPFRAVRRQYALSGAQSLYLFPKGRLIAKIVAA
eukprot:COSAG02_NODE_4953_length_4768_cov_11.582338_4_plen_56_part_00